MDTTGTVPEHEYRQRNPKGHWFDRDTLRFFKSRIGVHEWGADGHLYFVSSEKNSGLYTDHARAYSVRKMDKDTGDISTVGQFQEHKTRSQAVSAMRQAAWPNSKRKLEGE